MKGGLKMNKEEKINKMVELIENDKQNVIDLYNNVKYDIENLLIKIMRDAKSIDGMLPENEKEFLQFVSDILESHYEPFSSVESEKTSSSSRS